MKQTLVFVAALSAALLGATAANAQTIVDPSGSGDFTSIQDAIDSASAGDTIIVKDGTYSETLNFADKDNVTLQAENQGGAQIVGDTSGGPVINVDSDSDGVTINGFDVDGDRRRGSDKIVVLDGPNASLQNNDISVDTTVGAGGGALVAVNAGGGNLSNNTFSAIGDQAERGDVGVSFDTSGNGTQETSTLSNNTFVDVRPSGSLDDGDIVDASGNAVTLSTAGPARDPFFFTGDTSGVTINSDGNTSNGEDIDLVAVDSGGVVRLGPSAVGLADVSSGETTVTNLNNGAVLTLPDPDGDPNEIQNFDTLANAGIDGSVVIQNANTEALADDALENGNTVDPNLQALIDDETDAVDPNLALLLGDANGGDSADQNLEDLLALDGNTVVGDSTEIGVLDQLADDQDTNFLLNNDVQSIVTTNRQNIATNQQNIATNAANIQSNTNRIESLEDDVDELFGGVALSMAMSNAPLIDDGNTFFASGGVGFYGGETGYAARLGFMPTDNVVINGSIGGSSSGEVGGGVGAGIGF